MRNLTFLIIIVEREYPASVLFSEERMSKAKSVPINIENRTGVLEDEVPVFAYRPLTTDLVAALLYKISVKTGIHVPQLILVSVPYSHEIKDQMTVADLQARMKEMGYSDLEVKRRKSRASSLSRKRGRSASCEEEAARWRSYVGEDVALFNAILHKFYMEGKITLDDKKKAMYQVNDGTMV